MTRSITVPLPQAEEAMSYLRENEFFQEGYRPKKTRQSIIIAVSPSYDGPYPTSEETLEKTQASPSFKDELEREFGAKISDRIKTAYDIVGKIAILEIDLDLEEYKTRIGEILLETNNSIDTVVRKQGAHEGELRLQQYEILAGKPTLHTTVKENGIDLELQIDQTYYSVRSATERKRITNLVADNEQVLVMFSGAGPFVCVIAKHTEAHVTGVELNQDAHTFAQTNIRINKLTNAEVIQGDVREVIPELDTKYDRILMPLPHTAQDFLDVALTAAKKHCIIHLYHFSTEEEVNAFAERIPERLHELGRNGSVQNIERCGNLGPGIHRWCLDIEVKEDDENE